MWLRSNVIYVEGRIHAYKRQYLHSNSVQHEMLQDRENVRV